MQEDTIKVFCLAHGAGFMTRRSNRAVICKNNISDHVLSEHFPNSGMWFYCCRCQLYWVTPKGHGGLRGKCPACGVIKNPRYYSCEHCNVTMVDSWGATDQREIYITPWGAPYPYCPGCYRLPASILQSHSCRELNGLLTTAHSECPFCEVEENAELDLVASNSKSRSDAGAKIRESAEIYLKSDSKAAINAASAPAREERLVSVIDLDKEGTRDGADVARVEINNDRVEADEATIFLLEEVIEGWGAAKSETQIESAMVPIPDSMGSDADAADLFLEDFEMRTVETEQNSWDIKDELSYGSENEGNSLETVIKKFEAEAKAIEELAMKAVLEQARLEAVSKTAGDTIQIEAERNARLAAEHAIAEAEARARESEIKACQAKDLARQTEEHLRHEVDEAMARAQAALFFSEEAEKRAAQAEGRLRELEIIAREAEERYLEAVTGLQQEAARRRLAEERADKAEAKANTVDERNDVEITKIRAEFLARVREIELNARQVEEAHDAELQALRAELEAAAAAASQSEENHKNEYLEMEARASRAETRSRQVYLISKLSFAFVERVFDETFKMRDEKNGMELPIEFETNAYLEKLNAELDGSDEFPERVI